MNPTRTHHDPSARPAARRAAALAAVAALTAFAGCSGSDSDGSTDGGSAAVADAERAPEPADDGDRAALVEESPGAADTVKAVDPARDVAQAEPGSSVIRTGTVSLEAEDVGDVRFDVRRIVDQNGGAVTEQETATGDGGEVTTARLVLRVPSDRFEKTQAALEELATLTDSTSAADDVSTEVVDVAARVRAQRKSVARIEALLARATDLQQIVSIEGQLATRQAELDSLVSRQAYLADQTTMSTITVYVEQPAEEEAKDDEEETGFVSGLQDGWNSFVDGLVVALTVLGFLLPWLILVAVLGLPAWLVLRRRAGRRPASPPAPAAP